MSMPQAEYANDYAEKAAEIRPVIEALSGVDSTIDRLHHQIGRLAERLSPITQPEDGRVSPSALETVPTRPKSEVLHRVEAQGRKVDEAADRIANLLALLDL